MHVLVTGGAGFIGVNLVHRLLAQGEQVTVLDDFSTGLQANLHGLPVTTVTASLTDANAVLDACAGVDAIVHLAARGSVPRSVHNPRATHDVNATGTLNVLEGARRSGAFLVFSSSSSVYGSNAAIPKHEDMWTAPMTPYAASKSAAEGYLQAYAATYDVPATCFRFFNVFGPWQRPDHDYAAVIPKWIWAGLEHQPIQVNGDGSVTRDFTYVEDVVDVLVRALDSRLVHPRPINLAFGRSISLTQVLDELRSAVGDIEVSFGPPRPGDIARSENDPRLLEAVFPGLEPRPFAEAFRTTVEWLRESGDQVVGGPAVND